MDDDDTREDNKDFDNSGESDDSIADDMFQDCLEEDVFIPQPLDMDMTKTRSRDQSVWSYDKTYELPWRETLPFLRDPKLKFSVWSIIKNAIGKDLTKFSVPVYFNEPISMLQKGGEAMEYEELLVKANH